MDCRTAQSLINSYIEKKMTVEQLEQFLKHVESCPSCYDELETYFIVYYAMKRLDNDKEGSFNMSKLLHEDMKKRKRQVRYYRIEETILVSLILITGSIVILELLQMLGIILL